MGSFAAGEGEGRSPSAGAGVKTGRAGGEQVPADHRVMQGSAGARQ